MKIRKKIIGIYKITSLSNKIYIGQSWDIYMRWAQYHSRKSTSIGSAIKNSILKYGVINHYFEMLMEFPSSITQETLNKWESYYIKKYEDAGYKLLNLQPGGANGQHTEETKKKISKACKGVGKIYKDGMKNANSIEIYQYKDNILINIWPSMGQLSLFLGLTINGLGKTLNRAFKKNPLYERDGFIYSKTSLPI